MKIWCCVFLCFVGSWGLPLGDTEMKLLERLIKELETKQETKDPEIENWIASNLAAEFQDATLDRDSVESVKAELIRLINQYVDENGGNLKDCVYVAATIRISKHIMKDHIRPMMRAALRGLIDSVLFKLPVSWTVHDNVQEELEDVIKVITEPAREAMEHIKQEIATQTGLDLSKGQESDEDDEDDDDDNEHRRPRPEMRGKEVKAIVYKIIERISKTIEVVKELDFGAADPTTVCTALPAAARDAIAKELTTHLEPAIDSNAVLNELEKIDIGPDGPMVFSAIVTALKVSDFVKGPKELLTKMKVKLDEVVNGGANGSPLQALTGLMSTVLEKRIIMIKARVKMSAVLASLQTVNRMPEILEKPLNTLTAVELSVIATKLVTEVTNNAPASECMEVKLLAAVAGAAQMDRFLLYKKDGDIDTLKNTIVSELDTFINQLNLSPEQTTELIDMLKQNVDKIVAKMYISKMKPFVEGLESITGGKIASEVLPLALLEMAHEHEDDPAKEFFKEILELIVRIFSQKITCDTGAPVQVKAKIETYIAGLVVNEDATIEKYLREDVLAKICVLVDTKICHDSITGMDLTTLITEVKTHYGNALGVIIRELEALKVALEGAATPALALEATGGFAAKHAACVVYEAVKETPCPLRPGTGQNAP